MICFVFVFDFGFVFVTGLHGMLFVGALVSFTPSPRPSLTRNPHTLVLSHFVNSGKISVGGCACVFLMARGSMAHGSLPATRVLHGTKVRLYC